MSPTTLCLDIIVPAPEGHGKRACAMALPLTKSARKPLASAADGMVEGTLHGFPFRAALRVDADGTYWLHASAAVVRAAGARAGDTVRLEITRIGDEAETRPPRELRRALAGNAAAQRCWDDITPLARRDWILWITTAKKPETRLQRIRKACDMLAGGKRRVCCFPGLHWLTKDHVKPSETWAALPKS